MKKVLILNTRNTFVDDIKEVLKEKGFDITLLADCVNLAAIRNAVVQSDLCIVVTTFDERALHDDWHRLVLRQRFASDSVFSVGVVVGMMMSGASKVKFLLYKRDRIDNPTAFNTMKSVYSIPELRGYLDKDFVSGQAATEDGETNAIKEGCCPINMQEQGISFEANFKNEKQTV